MLEHKLDTHIRIKQVYTGHGLKYINKEVKEMIKTIFEQEKEKMKCILNAKQIVQNISYKMAHDLNCIAFFENIIENIKKYDSLERMDKIYFSDDLEEMRLILHLLYQSLQAIPNIKEKTADEIVKCCRTFPDNIGKRIIIQISYLPIMDLFYENFKYIEYIKKNVDFEETSIGQNILDYQQDRLFGKSILNQKFPKDEEFLDYKMRNEFIRNLREEYEETRKQELESEINFMLDLYTKDETSKIAIGSHYWDNKNKTRSEQSKAFGESIGRILEAMGINAPE